MVTQPQMHEPGRGIERASPVHVKPVWDLIQRAAVNLAPLGIRQWTDNYPSREVVQADVARGDLFVITVDVAVLGCVTLDARPNAAYAALSWSASELALVIHRLCIDPEFERVGLARALMDFAEHYARSIGVNSIRLDTYPTNLRAVQIYEQRQYRYVGPVQFPGRELPSRCYELVLK